MEIVMNTSLRSVHPAEAKEITPLGVWILSRLLIATSMLMFVPFALYLWQTS
jgi:hypothetical protein